MDERLENLLEKANGLPKSPGVYLMKDDKGRVIYIGKSACLRDRVCSYFQPATKLEYKKAPLRDLVVDFDYIQTESEVEALLAENRLIKDIQPKFNARLLDDKTFPYLMVTTDEDFPGVYVTSEPRTKGVKLYGPFTSVYQLKEAVTLLQKAFQFRTCHLEIKDGDDSRKFFRPCLLYAIGQCTAPCAAKVSRDSYGEDVTRLLRFLEGNHKQVLRDLEKEMIEASKDQKFERAAKLRDEIKALQGLNARAKKGEQQYWQPEAFITDPKEGVAALQEALVLNEPPRIIEGIDIAHLQGGEMVGSKVCFIDGVPFKDGYRRYKIKHEQGNNDYLSIQEVVSRRYREAGPPAARAEAAQTEEGSGFDREGTDAGCVAHASPAAARRARRSGHAYHSAGHRRGADRRQRFAGRCRLNSLSPVRRGRGRGEGWHAYDGERR